MTTAENFPPPARKRGPPRRIVVDHIETLSPRMRRIRFTGEDLAEMEWRGPAGHLKLIVPADGEHAVPVPDPTGPRPTLVRTYTPRRFNKAARQLDIDFVLHAHGPAGRWAARAQVGDQLVMLGPAPGYNFAPDTEWLWFIGDETALPALECLLDELPATVRARALVEVADAAERRTLPAAERSTVEWLPRTDSVGAALENAANNLGPLPSGLRVYVACEAMAMRRIRALLKQRGVSSTHMVTRGYWRHGVMNHPDHDFGEDA